jgi:prophage antirepressor-like protein
MAIDKYTIEVSDEFVKISGQLSIREAFDFLNFFDKEGYGILESDEYGTTICMRKGDIGEERRACVNAEVLENIKRDVELFDKQIEINKQLEEKVKDLEYLIKIISTEKGNAIDSWKKATENLEKFKSLQRLQQSAEAIELVNVLMNNSEGN